MIIHDVHQNTSEWLNVRKGIPTASQASKLLTATGAASTQKTGYMHELIAKRFDAHSSWGGNASTERGHELEPEAVEAYEFITDLSCEVVGFITTDEGTFGCSPDRLVGSDGGVQIKCCEGKEHVKIFIDGKLPTKHAPQVYSELWTCERDWWDFFAYHPKLPPLRVRTLKTDEKYLVWVAKWEPTLEKFSKSLESSFAKVAK